MKKRFSEEQIIGFLREAEAGMPIKDLCRRHGFSEASYYLWRSKFGGMSVPDAKRLKDLEAENTRLKKLLAEQVFQNDLIRMRCKKTMVSAPARRALVREWIAGGASERCALAAKRAQRLLTQRPRTNKKTLRLARTGSGMHEQGQGPPTVRMWRQGRHCGECAQGLDRGRAQFFPAIPTTAIRWPSTWNRRAGCCRMWM